MSITFTSKNTKLTGALKGFVEKNLRNIEKITGDIISSEVIVTQEKLDYRVEISLKTRLNSYYIEGKDQKLKQAVRTALGILKSQAKKNKEKMKKDKKRLNKRNIFNKFVPYKKHDTEKNRKTGEITISNNFSPKPLSVEEALFFLKDSGENAYMFTNTETNIMSVVFFNKNNEISIIEANL